MVSSDFRLEARRKLSGKWGKVACITLAYLAVFLIIGVILGLISGILSFSEESTKSFSQLVNLVIEVPLAFGLIISLYKVYNSEDVKAFDFFSLGFQNFKKSWGISLRIVLKLIVPLILIIVSILLIAFGSAATILSSGISAITDSHASGSIVFSSFITLIGAILYLISIIWFTIKSYYYQLAYVVSADQPNLTSKEVVNRSEEMMKGNRGKLFCLQFSFIGWAILAVLTIGIGYLWLLPYIQFATFAFYSFLSGKGNNVEVAEDNH